MASCWSLAAPGSPIPLRRFSPTRASGSSFWAVGWPRRRRSAFKEPRKGTTRSNGDCPSGSIQSARGWKGGRTRRLSCKTLPRCWLVDVADPAHAAEVAVGVVAFDPAAADVAGIDHITGGDIGGRTVGAVVG